LANLQQTWLIIAQTPRTAVRAGERFEVSVALGAADPPEGARLKWRFASQSGQASISASACAFEGPLRKSSRAKLSA